MYVQSEFHLNKVFFGGYVGRDPIYKQMPNIDICELSFCVPLRRVKSADERKKLMEQGAKDLTDFSGQMWLDVTVFGKAAKPVASKIKKGDRIIVCGRMESSNWVGQDGQRHSRLKVVADDVTNISGWQLERTKHGIITSGADDCAIPPPEANEYEREYTGGAQPLPQASASDFRKPSGKKKNNNDEVTFSPTPTKAKDGDDIDADLNGAGYTPSPW